MLPRLRSLASLLVLALLLALPARAQEPTPGAQPSTPGVLQPSPGAQEPEPTPTLVPPLSLDSVAGALGDNTSPLWNLKLSESLGNLEQGVSVSLHGQISDLVAYGRLRASRWAFGAVLFGLILLGLRVARRHMRPELEGQADLALVARILESPVAVAILLTVALGRYGSPEAPALYRGILGAVALVPAVLTLRHLLEPYLKPVLTVLVAFYLADQVRLVVEPIPTLARLVFLAEALAGVLFASWYLHPGRFRTVPEAEREVLVSRVTVVDRAALGLFLASAMANLLGFVDLATLLGGGTLRSGYAALVLLATLRILQGLVLFALHARPLVLSRAVQQHRELLASRSNRGLQYLALAAWLVVALQAFGLRQPLVEALDGIVNASLPLGTFHLSLGDLLVFGLSVWGASLLSRFLRFLLDEDVCPRLSLHRGTATTLSTALHYAVLVLGFLFALAAVGLDLTKVTVVLGALSVGIGFGLQNIVNNFVSGLILLFDPSLSVGDPIQFGSHQGELVRIGLRASAVRLLDGRELIVPNSALITQQIINGAPAGRPPRKIEITFALVGPVEGGAVLDLLRDLACSHPDVLSTPAPEPLFLGFQDGAPSFQLQAWTSKYSRVAGLRSELALALGEALQAGGYRVAGARRDVHLLAQEDSKGA